PADPAGVRAGWGDRRGRRGLRRRPLAGGPHRPAGPPGGPTHPASGALAGRMNGRRRRERQELGMPSPFPGMNPYLEQEDPWHDFHERFMPMAAAMLEPQVGDDYIVKIDENVYIHDVESDRSELLGRA